VASHVALLPGGPQARLKNYEWMSGCFEVLLLLVDSQNAEKCIWRGVAEIVSLCVRELDSGVLQAIVKQKEKSFGAHHC